MSAEQTRPKSVFDRGLQHERTALSWERTAVSMMVVGMLLTRYAATNLYIVFAVVGLTQVVGGAVLLVWAGIHYEQLHGPLRAGEAPVHPVATSAVGVCCIVSTALALLFVLATTC